MADSTPTTPRGQMIRGVSVGTPSKHDNNNITYYVELPPWSELH